MLSTHLCPQTRGSGSGGAAGAVLIAGGRRCLSPHRFAGSGEDEPSRREGREHRAPLDEAARALRILLIDDNAEAIESLEMILTCLGYVATGVTRGRDALDRGAAFLPDVVLLDLGMPEMDGYEVAAAIRGAPWGAHVRIIALTGWGAPEHFHRSMQAGFEAHLLKPLNTDQLLELLGSPNA